MGKVKEEQGVGSVSVAAGTSDPEAKKSPLEQLDYQIESLLKNKAATLKEYQDRALNAKTWQAAANKSSDKYAKDFATDLETLLTLTI